MTLKGVMTIELTDENTGAVETVTEENMITESVNNILGLNPMGIFYAATGEYDDAVLWNDNLLPICPNMIGGILLFSEALAEDEELLYESSDNLPVAYASNDVNSTANLARGSLNLTESMAFSNGYKFVWEFTPNQGNGTIAAVALTSSFGGENGFGSLTGDANAFLQLKAADIGAIPDTNKMVLFEAVELDFEDSLLYSITFENAGVRIRKLRIPVFSIGLNEPASVRTSSGMPRRPRPRRPRRCSTSTAAPGVRHPVRRRPPTRRWPNTSDRCSFRWLHSNTSR